MRTRNLFVASVAIALLFVGAIALPGGGSTPVARPLTARLMAATRVAQASDGAGYWLVDAKGRVFAFGGVRLFGSMAGKALKSPITGIVATADNRGYWLVAADGGVFGFGDAKFSGSLGSKTLTSPIVGMASRNSTNGSQGPAGQAGPRGFTGASGTDGNTGARGSTGATGTNGSPGTNGTNGSAGGQGPTGATGAAGTNGSNGTNGATGPTGPSAGLPGYGYVFNAGAQTVPIESAIAFDQNGPLLGITHAPGNAGIVVTSSGTYSINFNISGVEPGQFGVFVNGAPAAGTVYGSGAGTQQDIGQAFLTLSANDIVTIVNHSGAAAVTLQTLAGGTQTNVNASVAVLRLG